MKKQGKKILKGSLVITIIAGVIILLTVGGMYLISESKEANEVLEESQILKEKTQNEEIVVDISKEEIEPEAENTTIENISTNEEIPVVQEKAQKEIKSNTNIPSPVNKDQKDVNVNKNKQETPKQEKVETPPVTTVPTNPVEKENTNKTPVTEPPKVKEEPKKDVHTYKYNATITEKIKQDIKNNESTYMKQYGYTIVIDESIVTQTNQFTYTNNRVKNMITNKFGTIKIYARDYYLNGNYMYTESYII